MRFTATKHQLRNENGTKSDSGPIFVVTLEI